MLVLYKRCFQVNPTEMILGTSEEVVTSTPEPCPRLDQYSVELDHLDASLIIYNTTYCKIINIYSTYYTP